MYVYSVPNQDTARLWLFGERERKREKGAVNGRRGGWPPLGSLCCSGPICRMPVVFDGTGWAGFFFLFLFLSTLPYSFCFSFSTFSTFRPFLFSFPPPPSLFLHAASSPLLSHSPSSSSTTETATTHSVDSWSMDMINSGRSRLHDGARYAAGSFMNPLTNAIGEQRRLVDSLSAVSKARVEECKHMMAWSKSQVQVRRRCSFLKGKPVPEGISFSHVCII